MRHIKKIILLYLVLICSDNILAKKKDVPILGIQKAHIPALFELGLMMTQAQQTPQAYQIWEQFTTEYPNHFLSADAYLNKAKILLNDKAWLSASEQLYALIKKYPYHPIIPETLKMLSMIQENTSPKPDDPNAPEKIIKN